MPETKLASSIGTPNNKLLSLLNQAEASIPDCHGLFQSEATLILDLLLFVLVYTAIQTYQSAPEESSVDICLHSFFFNRFCTLAIIIPTPNINFTLAVDNHSVTVSSRESHDWRIIHCAFGSCFEPLS